jgi:hypothetical protein
MVVTAKIPITKRSQPTNTPMEAGSAPPTSDNSLFGDGPAKTGDDAPTSLKRKITDPNLEVITIDAMNDLTLIVGTPAHPKGQKAFQVSQSSFRNVSIAWTKMLSGNWAESYQSEIELPDDSCDAFLIVLRIAHFQIPQLPENLSQDKLHDLAILTDKYALQDAVRVGIELKKWLEPYRQSGVLWPALQDLVPFATITHGLNILEDFKRIVSRLAMETRVDDEFGQYYFYDAAEKRVVLHSSLPSQVTSRYFKKQIWLFSAACNANDITEQISRVRSSILTMWITRCTDAMDYAILVPETPCKRSQCAATKVSVLMIGLRAAGFYPTPSGPEYLNGSIKYYWTKLKNDGSSLHAYAPCKGKILASRSSFSDHTSICSFKECFGDFGIVDSAKNILQNYAHIDVWKQWQAVSR